MSAPDPATENTPLLKAALPLIPTVPMSCVIQGEGKSEFTNVGPKEKAWAISPPGNVPL